MDEIVLINPDSPFLWNPRVMPPLGLLYIASSLKQQGVKVGFVDLAGNSEGKIPKATQYGITATTAQYPFAVKIRKQLFFGDLVIGGPHATLCSKECLDDGFDAVVVGEGEKAVFKFLEGKWGTIYEPIKNIDEIPFPDRSLVTDYCYEIDGLRATTIMTSRGCYWRKCAFCSQNWPKIRYRSAENVKEELKEIRNHGYNAVMIYDDEFFSLPDRDYLIAWNLQQLELAWRCFSRADLITEDSAHVAGLLGCREILVGFESGSNVILKNIEKGTTVDQNQQAIELLHKYEVRVKAAMIIMLPGESRETLKETWKFCEEVESMVSDWDFTICTPYHGSKIYEHPERYDFGFKKDSIYTAYKGAGSSNWRPPNVWTSQLNIKQGLDFRDRFEQRFKFHRRNIKFE